MKCKLSPKKLESTVSHQCWISASFPIWFLWHMLSQASCFGKNEHVSSHISFSLQIIETLATICAKCNEKRRDAWGVIIKLLNINMITKSEYDAGSCLL